MLFLKYWNLSSKRPIILGAVSVFLYYEKFLRLKSRLFHTEASHLSSTRACDTHTHTHDTDIKDQATWHEPRSYLAMEPSSDCTGLSLVRSVEFRESIHTFTCPFSLIPEISPAGDPTGPYHKSCGEGYYRATTSNPTVRPLFKCRHKSFQLSRAESWTWDSQSAPQSSPKITKSHVSFRLGPLKYYALK